MVKHDVALKQKALQLELKGSHLRKYLSHPIWVLFESQKPIGTQLLTTLHRLMPSIDRILTSLALLFENLQIFFRNKLVFTSSNQLKTSNFLKFSSQIFPSTNSIEESPQTQSLLDLNSFIYLNKGLVIQASPKNLNPFLAKSSNQIDNYSHKMKKEFTERNKV